MKKNYRICSAFLALVLCLGLCPVSWRRRREGSTA